MRILLKSFALLFLTIATTAALAGTAGTELDKTIGTMEDQFQLTITISGKLDGDVPEISIPNCEIVSTGTSSRYEIGSGGMHSEVIYTYQIVPNQPGKYSVPSLKLRVDDKETVTLPIPFEVRDDNSQPQGRNQNRAPSQASPGGSPNRVQSDPSTKGSDLFVDREISSSTIYEGEPVLLTTRLFMHLNVTRAERTPPSSGDFRIVDVPGAKDYQQILDGKRFAVNQANAILIPQRAGNLTLPPSEFHIEAVVNNTPNTPRGLLDLFGSGIFSFGRPQKLSVRSEPLTIQVKPLPTNGRPPGFKGLVGDFHLNTEVLNRQVKQGESATIKLTIEGAGSLDVLDAVENQFEKVGRVYADKPDQKEDFSGSDGRILVSRKIFSFAVVPQKVGQARLGAVSIPYFNPVTGKYATMTADLGALEVAAGAAAASAGQGLTGLGNTTTNALASDIPCQNPGAGLLREGNWKKLLADQEWSWAYAAKTAIFALIPWLVAWVLWFFLGGMSRQAGSNSSRRAQEAFGQFHQHVKQLLSEGTESDRQAALDLLHQFSDFIGRVDAADTSPVKESQAMTAAEALTHASHLLSDSNDPFVAEKLAAVIGELEHAGFGHRSFQREQLSEWANQLDSIAEKIFKVISSPTSRSKSRGRS